jgi:putative MATE family efflux protein
MKRKEMNMLEGRLDGKILSFALPLAAASILQQLFNSADLAVVGRFDSSASMAAVGSNASVIALLISLFIGLSTGANVVIAAQIGRGEKKKVSEAVHTEYLLAIICGFLLMFIGIPSSHGILLLMGAPEEVMNKAILYLRIYFLGMPFFMIYNFASAVLRAKGDSQRPLLALLAGGIINVVLNLFFVIVMHLSVAGVAIATDLSNGVSALYMTICLLREEEPYRLSFRRLKISGDDLKKTFAIGFPAGLQGVVFSLSNVVIQSAINSFGSDAIAGASAAGTFETMAYYVINAFAQTAVTFTSQNYAARKYDRCRAVFRKTWLYGTLITLIVSLVFWFGRGFFLSFFSTDPDVLKYAEIRLLLVGTLEIGTGLYEISGGCLRGMGKSMTPAALTIIGSCLFRLIYVNTVFVHYRSFVTLFLVYPISWLITGAMVLYAYFSTRRQLFSERL